MYLRTINAKRGATLGSGAPFVVNRAQAWTETALTDPALEWTPTGKIQESWIITGNRFNLSPKLVTYLRIPYLVMENGGKARIFHSIFEWNVFSLQRPIVAEEDLQVA